MTKKQRVQAALAGEQPDHPPVSFWHHFPADQWEGQSAVDAHARFLETFDLDFLKVMNDHQYPRAEIGVIESTADLKRIQPQTGDVEGFGDQLDIIHKLRTTIGNDILMCTTIFNPWATLRYLTAPPADKHGPPKIKDGDNRDKLITKMLEEDRSAVKTALEAIGRTLADFAAKCIAAGADGVFLSVRDDWVNTNENGPDTYDELLRDIDRSILSAASDGTFNFLHMCGKPLDFAAFAAYPAHVINWADRAAGPSIAYARDRAKPVIAGGVDNLETLAKGTPDACAEEVRDALRQAKGRPIMITPGCTFDPDAVPAENLHAVVATAKHPT